MACDGKVGICDAAPENRALWLNNASDGDAADDDRYISGGNAFGNNGDCDSGAGDDDASDK
eukprot:3036123-Pleurochrysis_carterae.AAC.2